MEIEEFIFEQDLVTELSASSTGVLDIL